VDREAGCCFEPKSQMGGAGSGFACQNVNGQCAVEIGIDEIEDALQLRLGEAWPVPALHLRRTQKLYRERYADAFGVEGAACSSHCSIAVQSAGEVDDSVVPDDVPNLKIHSNTGSVGRL